MRLLLSLLRSWLLVLPVRYLLQQNESLNYNIVNVQAEASREVSNDQMHAVLYIEKSHKQPAELASQINQLMSQAIATARKYPHSEN